MGVLRRRRKATASMGPSGPGRRFRLGLALLVGVLTLGTGGYVLIGLDPFEALYQTAITVTTVGYGEIGPPDEVDRTYRSFTMLLVLLGASTVVYTASALLGTVVEGSLNDGIRRRRMLRQVDKLNGHVIVAGWGRVGRAVAHYARRTGIAVVVVDVAPADSSDEPLMVVGDANDDDTLLAAGIERAASLIAALSSDNDNLSLTLTARSLRSDLFIVARVANQRNERKFLRAGADRVVNPYEIGGSRMGALAFQPHVAEFLDEVLGDEVRDTALREVPVDADSTVVGTQLGKLADRHDIALILAMRRADGRYTTNPTAATCLAAGDVLIALGSSAQLERLDAVVAPSGPLGTADRPRLGG
jgi:voltage-gated potassium channel